MRKGESEKGREREGGGREREKRERGERDYVSLNYVPTYQSIKFERQLKRNYELQVSRKIITP